MTKQEFDRKPVCTCYQNLLKERDRRKEEGAEGSEWLPGPLILLYLAGTISEEEKEAYMGKLRGLSNTDFTSEIYCHSARHLLHATHGDMAGEHRLAESLRTSDYMRDGRLADYISQSYLSVTGKGHAAETLSEEEKERHDSE